MNQLPNNRMEDISASEQQPSTAAGEPEAASRPPNAPTNDNSNPQQGSGGLKNHPKMGSQPPPPMPDSQEPQDVFKIPPTKKDARKLFVGGLPSDVTEHEFLTFFEQFGDVLDSVVMFDRETQRSRGFGFITFVDPEVSRTLLNMGNHPDGVGRLVMRGKTCEVKAAQPKDATSGRPQRGYINRGGDRRSHQKQHNHPPGGYNNMHPFPGGFQPHDAINFAPPHPDVMAAAMHHPYPHHAHHGIVPGYPAPMYFPPSGAPTVPPVHPYFVPTGTAPINHPGPYVMGNQYMQPGASSGVPAVAHVPPNHQPQYAPMMTPQPPPQMAYHPQSVMQPVAPGLPTKEEDGGTAEGGSKPTPN